GSEDVAARESGRDGGSLDGGRAGEAELARRTEEGGVEAEAGEGHERAGVGHGRRSRNGVHRSARLTRCRRARRCIIDRALAATCDALTWGDAAIELALAALEARDTLRATELS